MTAKNKLLVLSCLSIIVCLFISFMSGCYANKQSNNVISAFAGLENTEKNDDSTLQSEESDIIPTTGEQDYDPATILEESKIVSSLSGDLDSFKLHEGEKLAITEPNEFEQQIITVYKQLYPECESRQPLLLDTAPYEGEIIFVPEEWYQKGYPAILGRHIFEQIADKWLCAYLQNEEFRFGIFDQDFVLQSDVISWKHHYGMNCIWPCKVFEKDGEQYIAVEYYYGNQGIHSSSTVIYSLPSLREIWNDSEVLCNDPQLGYDQYRFEINGDWFDIYEYEYHNGYMEPHCIDHIRIDSISLKT